MSRKKIGIYLVVGGVFICGVFIKQHSVLRARAEDVVSVFSEWGSHGKPAVVGFVKERDVPVYAKITVWPIGHSGFATVVSKSVRDRLAAGQSVMLNQAAETVRGTVLSVSGDIDINTGMFAVAGVFERSVEIAGWEVVDVNIGVIRNAIYLPSDMIEFSDGEFFVWKVENGQAVRQPVSIARYNGAGAVISSGIAEGDLLVYEGGKQLREKDRVNIVSMYTEEQRYD